MGKIYKNQDRLKIRAHIGYTLSGATTLLKYTDPVGAEGSWAITVEDEFNGVVYKQFDAGEYLGTSGIWTFWAHVTFEDGRVAIGEAFQQMIYDEGS